MMNKIQKNENLNGINDKSYKAQKLKIKNITIHKNFDSQGFLVRDFVFRSFSTHSLAWLNH